MDKDLLLTAIYVIICDIFDQTNLHEKLVRPGQKPKLTDQEVITLIIFQEFTGIVEEDDYWKYVNNNLRGYFPDLMDRSQYNRRKKNLVLVTNFVRMKVVEKLLVLHPEDTEVFDTIPVDAVTYTKASKAKKFEDADFGYCSSKKKRYFGYKLGFTCTAKTGILTDFEIGGANFADIDYARSMLYSHQGMKILADKAMISEEFEKEMQEQNDSELITPKRKNMQATNTEENKSLLRIFRNRVETVGSQLVCLFNLQHEKAKSQLGLFTRIVSKITAYTLGLYINSLFGYKITSLDHLTGIL